MKRSPSLHFALTRYLAESLSNSTSTSGGPDFLISAAKPAAGDAELNVTSPAR